MERRIDIARLIKDCGGPHAVSLLSGINRTTVYSMIRRNKMNTDQLATILTIWKTVDLRAYIVE